MTMEIRRTRAATRPIPPQQREAVYMAVWDLAWSGHFYSTAPTAAAFFGRFGSGSMVARRHGLTILWLTALAARFNELASLQVRDVDGTGVTLQRSKRGSMHVVQVDQTLIDCTRAWHNRVSSVAIGDTPTRWPKELAWCRAMRDSQFLLPANTGGPMCCNVFNRDVMAPLGDLFGLRLSSHCCRDTACQVAMRLVSHDASLDMRAVQAFMGHQSLKTTEYYLRKANASQLCLPLESITG
jgi:integrase